MTLIALGLSHKTSPVELRERFALNRERLLAVLRGIQATPPIQEAAVLSTCNRFEVYAKTALDARAGLFALEEVVRSRICPDGLSPRVFYRFEGQRAVQQLFRVAAGLDSQVVGESEILGQVKDAYQLAAEAGTTGKLINVLFQRALYVGKLVRTQTHISEGISSIGSAAVHFAEKIFGTLEGKRVLLIGAGKMAEVAVRHLLSHAPGALVILNRTRSKAEELARMFNGVSQSMEELNHELLRADIVIASTAAEGFILSRDMVAPLLRERRGAPIYFVDIGVPRNIDPSISELESAHVYNIDDLKDLVGENLVRRMENLGNAECLLMKKSAEFSDWMRSLRSGRVVPLRHAVALGTAAEGAYAAADRQS